MTDLVERLIDFDEGEKSKPYQDEKGIWTVGIGHNLEANGLPAGICADAAEGLPWPECLDFINERGGLQQPEIDSLFQFDLKANCSWLWEKPWWADVNEARQAALDDMAFNLGPVKMQAFTTFLGLCSAGAWVDAANDLEFKTAVAKELPKRYGRLEQILRTGDTTGVFPGG